MQKLENPLDIVSTTMALVIFHKACPFPFDFVYNYWLKLLKLLNWNYLNYLTYQGYCEVRCASDLKLYPVCHNNELCNIACVSSDGAYF